jgi:hypothetical protein
MTIVFRERFGLALTILGLACVASTSNAQTIKRRPKDIRELQRKELPLQYEYVCDKRRSQKPSQATMDSLTKLRQLLRPQFTTSMPARFGHDANANGMLDVPNTASYVTNGASGTPLFTVFLDPSDSEPTSAALFAQWTVKRADGTIIFSGTNPVLTTGTSPQPLKLSLAEGKYEATIRLSARYSCFEVSHSRTKSVSVNDFLVVAIGDSYASGEGNPERAAHNKAIVQKLRSGFNASYDQKAYEPAYHYDRRVTWADDGSTNPVSFFFKYHAPRFAPFGDNAPIDLDPFLLPKKFNSPWGIILGQRTDIALSHLRAHRSTVAWPAQLASLLEESDPESSVTFLFLAATGATISKGLLGRQKGSKTEVSFLSEPMEDLPGQLDAVKKLVGNREIDLLVLSIGANDLGFGSLAAALLLEGGFSDITPNRIEAAIKTGDWGSLEDQELEDFTESLRFLDPDIYWAKVPGLNGLAGEFQKLADKMKEPGHPVIRNVLISQYPDLTRDSDGSTCDEILTEFSQNFQTFRITDSELAFARDKFLKPMNGLIADMATSNGWLLLDGLNKFATHGVCAGTPYGAFSVGYSGNPWPKSIASHSGRWFRTGSESLTLQGLVDLGSTLGLLHPNEFGHAALAKRAVEVLQEHGVWPR